MNSVIADFFLASVFCDCLILAEHLIFSSVEVLRIRILHLKWIRIQIQGFDELKYKKLKFTYP